ncbi:hypothetical protein ACLEQD_29805 [Corallococcus sp. 4LFB]
MRRCASCHASKSAGGSTTTSPRITEWSSPQYSAHSTGWRPGFGASNQRSV